jgi:glutamate-1-semialdehyde 2,1-aminomutase
MIFIEQSEKSFERAKKTIPGGVNSPVRAFRAVGGTPRFIASAHGCRLVDVDGNEYIDYVGSWGPMILGHAHPGVVSRLQVAASMGTSYGAPTEAEVYLAEKIAELVPSVEKVRLVNSGTEATMTALRLARAATGRPLVVKFDGCYHGHSDSFLIQAGSGIATLGLPDSPGVPHEVTEQTISLPFNRIEAVRAAFDRYAEQIAAVIFEPVTGNMGVVVPPRDYLRELVEIADKNGALVVFDEVMTGFRVALGGAQELYSLCPQLTCMGKVVGGGLPIGAVGGRAEIMDLIAPIGPVYQAGTLSGNPLAVAAGLETLRVLEEEAPYNLLAKRTEALCEGLRIAASEAGVDIQVQSCGSMFTVFFTSEPVVDFESAKKSNLEQFSLFFQTMLEKGIYLAPSQFEACFVSLAHDEGAIAETIEKARSAFRVLG